MTIRNRFRPGVEALEDRSVPAGMTVSDSGGFEGSNQTLTLAGNGGGKLTYSYEHFSIPDNFIIRYEGNNLLETGFVGGSRSGTVQVPMGNSNTVEIVVATNDSGTAWNYTVTADDCADTTPFTFTLQGGDFTRGTDAGGNEVCTGTGTIIIGRSDGLGQLIKVNGTVSFDKNEAKINGTVTSLIGAGAVLNVPLFTGSFTLPFNTGTATDFSETPAAGEYTLGGLDVDFSGITLNPNGIALGAKFELIEELGFPDFFLSGSDALLIGPSDVSFGQSVRASVPNLENINLFGFLPIKKFDDFSIEYIAPQDAIKIQGSIVVDLKGKTGGAVGDVTANLAGSNFIQIKGGQLDVVGELSAETDIKLVKGWGLKELKLTVDTIMDEVGGTAKLTFPFGATVSEVAGTVEFRTSPFELNKLMLEVDMLNKPLPIPSFPGVFFQGFRIGVDHLASSDPDPISFTGGVSATLGPQVSVSLQIPSLDIDFSASGALVRVDLDGTGSAEMVSGTSTVTVIHESILRATGTTTLNWDKKFFEQTGALTLLDGLITTNTGFKIANAESPTISLSGTAAVGVPKFVPLVGGAQIASGNYQVELSADGSLANDFVAGWGVFRIQKLGLDLTIPIGFKVFLDGRVERIGAKDIPPVGSWNILPGTEYALVAADWENEVTGNVPVRVKLPNGTFVEEADFAANGIAIVEELTDSRTKVVLLANPTPGIWDLEVVDPTGLGAVTYLAVEEAAVPTITATAPAAAVPGGAVTLGYTAADPDSAAEVRLYYDTDGAGFDGVEITRGLAEADGPGSFVWNTAGVAPGTYRVYAAVIDGDNPPVFSYAPGTVTVTASADLSTAVALAPAAPVTGGTLTYTYTVSNTGSPADAVTATVALPAGATFVSSSLAPATSSGGVLTYNLGTLAGGGSASITVVATAPATAGTLTSRLEARTATFDATAGNDVAESVAPLVAPAVLLPDLGVTLTQPPGAAVLGQNYTFELTVQNTGAGPATNVTLREVLPGGVDFVSAVGSQGTAGLDFSGAVRAALGTIPAGGSATVRVTVRPFVAGNLVSTTAVTSDQTDAATLNNFLITAASVGTVAPTAADLSLAATADVPSPAVGETVTIRVTLSNAGPGIASGIRVRAALPAGLTFVSATPEQGTYDRATGVWDAGNVRDNLSRTLTLVGTATTAGLLSFTAEVISATEADPDSTPNNGVVTEDDFAFLGVLPAATPTPALPPVPAAPRIAGAVVLGDTLFVLGPDNQLVFAVQVPTGTVTLLTSDLTGDGIADLVVITPGVAAALVDGRDGGLEALFTDLTGDRLPDAVFFAPEGVKVFDGLTGQEIALAPFVG